MLHDVFTDENGGNFTSSTRFNTKLQCAACPHIWLSRNKIQKKREKRGGKEEKREQLMVGLRDYRGVKGW